MVDFGTHTPTPTHTTLLVAYKHRSAALPTQRWWCILGHTPTPTHTTLLVVASKHRSAALPTQRWWCMRWNVCASAVQSCPCRAFGTTNTTHTKNISLRCALDGGKKIPSQNPASSLRNHNIQTAALQSNGATNDTLARKHPRSSHSPANPALVAHFGTHTPTPTPTHC